MYGSFGINNIDWGCSGNEFSGFCAGNSFGPYTLNNDFMGDVLGNTLKGNMFQNIIGDNFEYNNIGFNFSDNTISQNFENNNIGNGFSENLISQNFKNNEIGDSFINNTIGEGFGFGNGNSQKNYIGDNFTKNTVGEYFYNNTISNYFENNTLGNGFQLNKVEIPLSGVDFTEYVGNINTVSYPTTSGTDGLYSNITGTTSGLGINAVFEIEVSSDSVSLVNITNGGKNYQVGDKITINSSLFGGAEDLILTIDALNAIPMVYDGYNKTIQKDFNGNNTLVAIANGNLYITEYITQPID